jgi:hypothetical protein
MSISASVSAAARAATNLALDALNLGPDNFSVPLYGEPDVITHYGLHSWPSGALLDALTGMPDVTISDSVDAETGEPITEPGRAFAQHTKARAIAWEGAEQWYKNPVMTGDERTFNGQLWVSRMDYNVWAPPIGWREVVAEGFPAWVQPTGAHDAYAIGDKVQHPRPQSSGAAWVFESKIAANTTEPGTDGTFDRWWTPVGPA